MDWTPPPERSPPKTLWRAKDVMADHDVLADFTAGPLRRSRVNFPIKVPYFLASHRPVCYNYFI